MGSHGTGQFGVVNRSTCIDSKYRGKRQPLSSCDPFRPVVDSRATHHAAPQHIEGVTTCAGCSAWVGRSVTVSID